MRFIQIFVKNGIRFTFLALALALMSCQRTPDACFNVSKFVVQQGESIQFTNCSLDGDKYEWDFGDGTQSNSANPSKIYNALGSYNVRMTVWSRNEKKSDETTIVITVGEKKLDHIVMRQLHFLDENGLAWDSDGSGPDCQFFFGRASADEFDWATIEVSDVTTSTLPITWITTSADVVLTDENWDWVMYDIDDTEAIFMSGWNFNPVEDDNNPILLTGSENAEWEIELHWSVR